MEIAWDYRVTLVAFLTGGCQTVYVSSIAVELIDRLIGLTFCTPLSFHARHTSLPLILSLAPLDPGVVVLAQELSQVPLPLLA